MDEFKIIFWIVVGIIYLLSKARGKQKKQFDAPMDRSEPTPEAKPISFEDLLREIQEAKNPKPPLEQKPVAQQPSSSRLPKPYDYQDFDDDLEEEEKKQPVKPDYKSDDQIYGIYEEAKKQAFIRPSLEETMKVEDTIVRYDQFQNYKKEKLKAPGMTYLNEFNDPEGFKRAFIMSEILNRKF